MSVLKAHLRKPSLWNRTIVGHVHSVFTHVVNLLMNTPEGDILLTVVPEGELLPDSLEATSYVLCALRSCQLGTPVCWMPGSLCWSGHFASVMLDVWTGRMPRTRFRWYGKDIYTLNVSAEKEQMVGESLRAILRALEEKRQDQAVEAAHSIIGLGGGLTPAADDALTGALAVFCTFNECFPFLTEELLARTTIVSTRYLQCAQHGFFSQRVISLMTPEQVEQSTAAISLCEWGGTSGQDTLYGIVLAQRYFSSHKE